MQELDPLQEKALHAVIKQHGKPRSYDYLDSKIGFERIYDLQEIGYITSLGNADDTFTVKPTLMGEGYFPAKHREPRRRWAPVLVSAGIGAISALLGAALGAMINGWEPF